MKAKRLYRSVAYYADGTTATRHFQTSKAANDWAQRRQSGYPEEWRGFEDVARAIPAAARVTVERSEPITWPDE